MLTTSKNMQLLNDLKKYLNDIAQYIKKHIADEQSIPKEIAILNLQINNTIDYLEPLTTNKKKSLTLKELSDVKNNLNLIISNLEISMILKQEYLEEIQFYKEKLQALLESEKGYTKIDPTNEIRMALIPKTISNGEKLLQKLYQTSESQDLLDLHSIGNDLYEELNKVNLALIVNVPLESTDNSSTVANTLWNLMPAMPAMHDITANLFNPVSNFVTYFYNNRTEVETSNQSFKKQEKINTRQQYLAMIVSMMWRIYSNNPAPNGELMKRGSYKIIDPGNKLFNFLHDYVKLSTDNSEPGFLSIYSGNQFAYKRDPYWLQSSHYKEDSDQFGIDMRFKEDHFQALPILPEGSTHLLFGKIKINNQEYTFIKFEPFGLGNWNDIYQHLTEFFHTQTNTPDPNNGTICREKDVPKELQEIYKNFCEISNIPIISKLPLFAMYQNMMNELGNNKQRTKELTAQHIQLMKNFVKIASEKKLFKNIEIRNGQEIIVNHNSYLKNQANKGINR